MTRASDCTYAAPSVHLLAREQKQTIEELENDKSALYEILWYLQTTSPEQATTLLDRLRANKDNDIGATLQHFAQHRREPSDATSSASKAALTAASPKQNVTLSDSNMPKSLDLPGLLDGRKSIQSDDLAAVTGRSHHAATVQGLEGPLQWFFNCVGALFYITNREEVQKNIESLDEIHVPLGDIVTSNKDLKKITVAAEIAGMASIGIVHAHLANSAAAPPVELSDYFYTVAKLGLDASIRYDPLRAVKICALLAMYNVIVHATVALAYLGTYSEVNPLPDKH
jgi:hypothetical protein